jgi:hypothetical protein
MSEKQSSEAGLAKLISHQNEPVKQYIQFDVDGRPELIYTAHFKTKDQEPCLVTHYEYVGSGSTQVSKRNEFVGKWDSATMNSTSPLVPDELKQ